MSGIDFTVSNDPVDLQLSEDEAVTVPDGVAWKVTLATAVDGTENVAVELDGETILDVQGADSARPSLTTTIHEGRELYARFLIEDLTVSGWEIERSDE